MVERVMEMAVKRIFSTVFKPINLNLARKRFASDEDGAVLVFSLVLFILMVMMGGFAVDLMRYETTRTTLQNTLDRSTLAAASLSQSLDPEAVVRDYFTKAGMAEYLTTVNVSKGLNFREVNANAKADTKPFFLHMIGIDQFDAFGASTAEQRIDNFEISLVLDVSGSMSGMKLANLKTAAKDFVDTVLLSDPEKRIAISIVPYNAQVNLGSVLRSKYTVSHDNGLAASNCLEVPDAMYGAPGISNTTPIPLMAHADISGSTDRTNAPLSTTDSGALPNFGGVHCKTTQNNIVRLPSQNIALLKSQIDGLQASGNTSIMAGMKWGLALLDPQARPMFAALIAANAMPGKLESRPFNYDDPESTKVIVLMTDGEHVSHTYVKDAYKTGPSPIYRSINDGQYSVFYPDRSGNKYWTPHRSEWRAAAWNNGTRQDWNNVWANLRASYVAWQFFARATGTSDSGLLNDYNVKMNDIRGIFTSVPTMDAQLQQSCALAKVNEVIVYGIAFDAPANGQQQIKTCTTGYDPTDPNGDNAYYFASTPENIKDAFATIATNISQLRLTQ